ncbi:MAG: hypothetical protein KIT73_02515, partial [Burkholderiales bacterium]|nr:hypothetical protein [Burkholderiales bacterium]
GKTGGYFYKAIAGGEQTEDLRKQASRELSSIGIKGIKYLDGGSRDNGEGTHNYVIFDDRAVEIANRQSEVAASFRKSEAILEAIRESWGEDTDALIKASRIQVVETADDLPGVHPANVQAVAMPDGTTFVVAQNVKPEQIRGLILHEVGVHHGMPAILGPERWAKLLADFEAMVLDAPDDAPIWAAWRKATQDTADLGLSPVQRQERVREEALAYLVQDAPESTLVQRIIAAVKRWINALIGDRLKLTDADLREMAIASLRGFKRREAGSVAPADETGGRYARGGKPSDELKPFDQAIERAKRYAEVLRMLATDGEEATRAAARDLTSDEITDLLKQLYTWNRRKRDSLRKAREGIQAEDRANAFQDEALKAADGLANNILMDATIAKRNAALNLAGRLRAASFIRQFGADAKSLSEGAKSLVAGGQRRLQGARSSAAAEQKQFRGEWVGGLIHDMEEAGLWELFVSDSLSRDVANAMWRIGRDKPLDGVAPEVKAMAEIVFRYQEAARGTKNRFGAWVRDLQGYIVRQSHDMWRIRDAGYEAWRDVVLPRLDIERTMRDVPEVAERSLDAVLREVYDGFASGLHLKYLSIDDVPPSVGPASLAKQVSASREIYFRDADAWFEYNEQFGVGSLSYAVLNGLDRSGHAAGLLKTLGTNPEGNLAAVLDHIEEGIVDPAERRAFHDNRASVLALLKHVTGEANIPANAIWAKRASNVRALQSMAKLGGAVVSSVTDIPVYASEIRFQGGNLFSGMAEAIGGLLRGRGSKEQKAILAEIGLFQESMVGDVMARFDADDLLGGLMSRGMQQFFKWNGLTWWTETLRSSIGLSTAHRMALATALPWEQLDPNLSSVLSLYNIDAGKWAVLRQAATKEADGMAFLTPEGMNAVPRSSLETYIQSVGRQANEAAVQNLRADLQAALRNMYIDRATHAVIEPDARTRWALLRDTQKGTLWGETARFVAQFKSFPTALLQRVYGREIQGRGYNSLTDMMRRGKGDMLGLIHLMLWMTLFGYGAMTAKDLLRGRKPRSLVDEDGRPVVSTMMSAMLQGGAMGIYGDLILGETNRVGGGLLQTLAGPSLGLAEDAFDLKNRIVAGRDFGPAALRLAVNNTPFANLFYVRPALDYLILYRWQEAMNPGYLRRLERDVEQKNRQEFLFRPSEVVQ